MGIPSPASMTGVGLGGWKTLAGDTMDRPRWRVSLPLSSALLTMSTIAVPAGDTGVVGDGVEVQFRHCVCAVAQLRMCCVVGH